MSNFRHSLLIIFTAAAWVCMMPRAVAAQAIGNTEAEVYAAYINHLAKDLPPNKSLLIEPRTALLVNAFNGDAVSAIGAQIPEASRTVIADLVRVGAGSVPLNISVRQEMPFAMKDEKLVREIFNTDTLTNAWKRFYGAYPKSAGLISFSRVGMDAEKKQALLYVDHACGGHCGNGYLVLLQLQGGRWEVVRRDPLWVS